MNNTPCTSLVQLPTSVALAAAAAMLSSVEAGRQAEREQTIEHVLVRERITEWRLSCWPRRRKLSRKEAEEKVDADDWSQFGGRNPYSWWRIRGWGTKALAERIQSAARLSHDGTIWLNLEEAEQVADYVPAKEASQ